MLNSRTLPAFAACALSIFVLTGCPSSNNSRRVVLYCALDREFSKIILDEFEKTTGIKVLTKFDTEANKSVGLYQDIVGEASRPRCDVFWNNEILSTIRLQEKGLLAPYQSPAAAAFPKEFHAADHSWHAFAARARIILVNTDLVAKDDWPDSLWDLTEPRWKNRIAIAKPQFGTTATQAACLFQTWGEKKAKSFYRALTKNQVRIVAGNKQVAEGVGGGRFAAGLTDTDDAMAEVRAGRAARIVFPGKKDGGTLFIPNTVCLIRNCPHPAAGKKLVDYLLGPKVERKLSQSESRQIPLNPQVTLTLPPAMRGALSVQKMKVDFDKAAALWGKTQRFLKGQFAR